ncbi:single-stranded DNA exonuclease RecJ [Thermosipho melanesiensis]|uniref:Single-stranded-DNA-specific exonuclease RecJ n=2 Tax=Thermosipho melanesiensis TaxID=46541 RepID=A6LJS2_THEM4|nr:single-stranded-DNA-specific exonuclease RecJ [Thermosipho melanesiensis]ABR30173.1 single-stranded-DNA-specific exonuclease RecJ [Thermosipho melanesiensis BI429]APT73372.1 single-stranded DNA exonuclease RecJ [Thermosipho melanesiensis]OOC38187.1 single-stranded DNA exonuclease RecJ [Thermosipho melanesiensis]OOC40108.1 single-stranded DNA exonuclease RecJ [Thermosipho melanesiensis]OOC40160.1 single-stranded DNA exonuclease RecJ [Thermosipho melanesiensis]
MKWELKKIDKESSEKLAEELDIPLLTAQLLVSRGYVTPESAYRFINPSKNDLRSPFLLKDMDRAVKYLLLARNKKYPILVYGDYDVDGITGVATLVTFLSKHGWKVKYFIPNRLDVGYGIQPEIVDEYFKKGYRLLLSVDCGITSFDAVKHARELGMYVVITDHHTIKSGIPNAHAVVDPKREDETYPFKDFAGVGVAYKLISALALELGLPDDEVNELLDIVALGTIADMVDLVDENRYIVKEGLKKLNQTQRVGLVQLMKKLNIKNITSQDIGYRLAPKLNAAGRLYSAEDAYKLITTNNLSSAEQLAEILMGYNFTRQEIENKIFNEAVYKIEKSKIKDLPILIVSGEKWHAGVLGIVATKLVQKYNKPSLVISLEDGMGRGSGRSVDGVNIFDVLSSFSRYFEEIGGHPMAVGFSIREEKIDELIDVISKEFVDSHFEVDSKIEIDTVLDIDEVNDEVINSLSYLEPFGHGNPEPVFLIKNSLVDRIRFFGNVVSNVRMVLKGKNKNVIEGIGFGLRKNYYDIPAIHAVLTSLDIVANIRQNGVGPFLNILDFKISSSYEEDYKDKYFIYSFASNWKNQKKDDFDHFFEDDELNQRYEKVEKYFSKEKPFVLQTDLLTRNVFLLKLMQKGKTLVVNPTNIEALHVYESLSRHSPKDVSFVNSLNRDYLKHVITNPILVIEDIVKLDDFDFVVLNETQILASLSYEIYERLMRKVRGKDFIITSLYKFESNIPVYFDEKRINFGLEDRRNSKKTVEHDVESIAFLFSNYLYVTRFYEKLVSRRYEFKDLVFYSPILKPFQKKAISTLIKKGRIKKIVSSTNSDGLPSMLENGAEVRLFDFPLSIKELIDAVSGDSYVILQLFYNQDDAKKRKEHLLKIFPDKRVVENAISKFYDLKIDNNEKFIDFSKSLDISPKVLKHAILDQKNGRKILRLLERELELSYFEKYTMLLLSSSIKDIYKMIEERDMYDIYLEV